ncbi:uncharacterized protein LOC126675295 [Mercurialis annua]|uniref:uncharacterized protein LOC126675295 n=1 Tax=Mercurialis annua TaxID=3986 RepID=UPI0021600148|nr:uncharacterized protein LOC126675295 [Mercurialis annua]
MRHAVARYKNNVHKMRNMESKHISVSQNIWDEWNAFWCLEDAKKKFLTARANRMSEPAGAGSEPVLHTRGSRSALKHIDVMAKELGPKPSAVELYSRLHQKKANKRLVDKRAQDMTDAIVQKLAAASQTALGEDSSSPANVDETRIFLDIEGVNNKHPLYGFDSATSRYAATSSRARGSSSRSQQSDQKVDHRVEKRMVVLERQVEERMAALERQ